MRAKPKLRVIPESRSRCSEEARAGSVMATRLLEVSNAGERVAA